MMVDPGKPVDLRESWTKAEVDIKLPVFDPRSSKQLLKRKKKGKENTSVSASGGKGLIVAEQAAIDEGKKIAKHSSNPPIHPSSVTHDGVTVGAGTSTPTENNKTARVSLEVAEADAEAQRLREEVDARLREKGLHPFVTDLEACQRVGSVGINLFRQISGGYAAQVSRTLRGKIASLNAGNSNFAGWLARVQAEMDLQRGTCFLDLSEKNRTLKEEVEKL